jgi:DNA polymerase-3 subunit alpha (Gram-positive type)
MDFARERNTNLRAESEQKLGLEIDSVMKRQMDYVQAEKEKKEIPAIDGGDAAFDQYLADMAQQAKAAEEAENNKNVKTLADQKKEQLEKKKNEKNEKKFGGGQNGYGGEKRFKKRPGDDPDCFYGRNCEGETIPISELTDNMGEVCIRGEVISIEDRELRSGKFLIVANITDYGDTIAFKLFVQADDRAPMLEELKVGKHYKLKGVPASKPFRISGRGGWTTPSRNEWSCICILS